MIWRKDDLISWVAREFEHRDDEDIHLRASHLAIWAGRLDFSRAQAQLVPLADATPMRCRHQRTVRGRSGWLDLLRRTLSSPAPSRFIPALSLSPFDSVPV